MIAMRTCGNCPQWAQWLIRTPIRGIDPADKEKKRQTILGWENIGYFCTAHKDAKVDHDHREIFVTFTGTIPDAAYRS